MIKYLLISWTYFMSCKVVPFVQKALFSLPIFGWFPCQFHWFTKEISKFHLFTQTEHGLPNDCARRVQQQLQQQFFNDTLLHRRYHPPFKNGKSKICLRRQIPHRDQSSQIPVVQLPWYKPLFTKYNNQDQLPRINEQQKEQKATEIVMYAVYAHTHILQHFDGLLWKREDSQQAEIQSEKENWEKDCQGWSNEIRHQRSACL